MDNVLLEKADELATKLSPAFDTQSGFPRYATNTYKYAYSTLILSSCRRFPPSSSSETRRLQLSLSPLAEIASFQMEYAYLGKSTGKKVHIDRVRIMLFPFHMSHNQLH